MEFFNKVLKKDEKATRIQNEIISLQTRKASVLSVIQNEIAELEREKNTVFHDAGEKAYEKWCEKKEMEKSLVEFWNKVQEIEQSIVEKQNKKSEMEARYSEEISLLQKDLKQGETAVLTQVSTPITQNAGGSFCPFCGASISVNDKFCEKCGAKLQ